MFRSREEQIRQLEIDDIISFLVTTGKGGYQASNDLSTKFEEQKQALQAQLKAEVALESSRKK